MKVGVLIEFTSDTDIDAKFAELKEMGVDSCQLVCWDRPTLQDDAMAEAINKGLEKYGIHATAFWCGWEGRRVWDFYEGQLTLGLIPSDYRVERLKMLMEVLTIFLTFFHNSLTCNQYFLVFRVVWIFRHIANMCCQVCHMDLFRKVRTSCLKQDRRLL